MKKKLMVAAMLMLCAASATQAQQVTAPAKAADAPPMAAPAEAKKPMVWALISAVGDQFTYVRQKQTVGSNIIDNNVRQVVKVQNDAVNGAVLRGLDRAIELRDPGSTRILGVLKPIELEGVLPQDREKVAKEKLLKTLEIYPGRMSWDRIIVVVPRFQFSERLGMGPKLQGIGLYVQPLERGSMDGLGDFGADLSEGIEDETITPDGKPGKRSSQYVAPYNYTQTLILDAKTLAILETSARYEYQKIYDPMSTNRNVEGQVPPDKMAALMTNFIERSMARSVGEMLPRITIGDVVPATPKADEPKK